jgi:DNA-binding response OmpR family regulator
MKVLLIEDDVQLSLSISMYIRKKGFDITSVTDGLESINYIDNNKFDLYIVDINLPSLNGLDIVSYIRKTDFTTPVIIITASLEINHLTTAYENGCNEYIKKPFHLKEFEIRMHNLLDIDKKKNAQKVNFTDDFYYDESLKSFFYNNNQIELRPKEKRFCELLIANKNSIVSNNTIYDYVWENEQKDNYPLRQLLNAIRKRLPVDIFKTKRNEGYIVEI